MSQQINLLVQEQRGPALSALRSLIGLGAILLVYLAYTAYAWFGSVQLGDTVEQSNVQLAAEKATLKDLEQKLGARPKREELLVQIEAHRAPLEESRQVINLLETGGGSSRDGYTGQMMTLARVSEEGVWLTGISIANAGRTVRLEGRSLRADAVMRYAQRLNEQFSAYGAQFTALELTPGSDQAATREDRTTAPGLSSVAFKLF